MCHRAKSPRYVRENVPAPNPPTGAPCQLPSSMSVLFFRTPGFGRGCPRGLRHAVFGISSAAQGVGVSAEKKEITASSNGKYLFIGPPKARSNGDGSPGRKPLGSPFPANSRAAGAGFVSRREEVVVCEGCAQAYRPALFAGSFWP